jgi:peptide/nickel transport system substrate-binding protein
VIRAHTPNRTPGSRLSLGALTVALAATALALVLAVGASSAPSAKAGGTYRVGWESSFGFTDSFDPTGEYLTDAWAIYSNLMIRTLVGYNHVAGPAGNTLVADLATSVPRPTGGGKIYTFRLKQGVKFGPPLGRPVTSKDVLYAFERMARPKNGAQYGFYYSEIAGFDAYGAGKAKTITGISTPDARTIVFRLTRPTGDFLYRLAMPATGPIPAEVAGCFEGKPGEYGRNIVSTGPYMFAGSDDLDASSCVKLAKASGFDAQTSMHLVRNPDYDAKTDSKAARESYPDEFVFEIDSNLSDIMDKVAEGELEDELPTVTAQRLRQYATDSDLRQYLKINSSDATFYVTMNLTQPPFDDIHVRKAMNWVVDKTALVQAWGGPLSGKVANHIVPDTMFNNQLVEFAPYKTPGDRGSVEKAKAAMKGSKYDTKHDGTCSADVCKGVLMLADVSEVDQKLIPVLVAGAKSIGITFTVRAIAGSYPTLKTTSKNIPISELPGWGKDYADPLTFFAPKFDGRTITASGNNNFSLVGLKPSQAPALGVKGTITGIPSVDKQLDRCAALIAQARLSCYEALDRELMTKVVPWIPYLWQSKAHIVGKQVTKWEYDQFSASTAYAHVAVK